MEETVLISKDEYETLMNKVSKENDDVEMLAEDNVSNGNGDGASDGGGGQLVGVNETVKDNVKDNLTGHVIPTTKDSESGEIDMSSSSPSKKTPPSPPIKGNDIDVFEGKKRKHGLEVEGPASVTTMGDNDDDNNVNMLNGLLSKVPSKLKEPVRLLAEYINDNGKGIIEWDDDLRLLYFKNVIPKTNFAKLLRYAFEKTEKRPKGSSIFSTALESIGIKNPTAWLVSQVPSEGNKKQKRVTSDIDLTDGAEVSLKSQPKGKKQTSKEMRFKKLTSKWVTLK